MVGPLRRLGVSLAACCLAIAALGAAGAAANTTVVPPGQSIQAAIDAAAKGDTIKVVGRHEENVAITTDRINLIGVNATLTEPATPRQNACTPPGSEEVSAICVLGDVNFETGQVLRQVRGVHVEHFSISGFDNGVFAFGARALHVFGNRSVGASEYGFAAFTSTNTKMRHNVALGDGGEAGFYIGDSPEARASVSRNESSGWTFGVFLRDATTGWVAANRLHDNCVGAVVLADAPGPAGDWAIFRNRVNHNTRACPGGEEGGAVSGVGIAIAGGHDNRIFQNTVTKNRPSGETTISGGIVVTSSDLGTAATANAVTRNVLRDNRPDLFWDSQGTNLFRNNSCATSVPPGLCS